MTGYESRTSCTLLFQSLEILAVSSQYILSLTKFLSHNLETYTFNITVHGINRRNILQLHKPTANLTLFQKGVYYMSIQLFNGLLVYTAEFVVGKKHFISTLKKYLVNKSFYSLEFIND